MRKNGFTLVEILAVIIIIGLVAVITVPNILNVVQVSKVNACKEQLNYLKKAAQRYVTDLVADGDSVPNSVSISQLYNANYLSKKNIKNPVTGNDFALNYAITITGSNGSYSYSFDKTVCNS